MYIYKGGKQIYLRGVVDTMYFPLTHYSFNSTHFAMLEGYYGA